MQNYVWITFDTRTAARQYCAGYRTSLLSQSQVTSQGSDQSQIWSQKLWNVCIASRHATLWDFWPSGWQINFIFGQRVNHHWLSPAGTTITRCPVKKRHEHPSSKQSEADAALRSEKKWKQLVTICSRRAKDERPKPGISRGWRRCSGLIN